MQIQAVEGELRSNHPHLQLPGLECVNIYIPNVSMPPQHRTAYLVIKFILLLTEIEILINLDVYSLPPQLDRFDKIGLFLVLS